MIAPVMSLAQLLAKANKEQKYRDLAIVVAQNFGYNPEGSYSEAIRQLHLEANEAGEDAVMEEVNALRSEV